MVGDRNTRRSCARLVKAFAILALGLLAAYTTCVAASVFYAPTVVAESGVGGFVSFGNGPSVNDKGKVAFIGRYSATANTNETVHLWTPIAGVVDIGPTFHPQNRTFGDSVRINSNDEVVAWTHTFGATPIYEVRVFRSATPNDTSVMVRAVSVGASNYDLLYQNPWINNTRVLEDRANAQPGNKDGVCDSGETCVSQNAFNAPLLPNRDHEPDAGQGRGRQPRLVLRGVQSRRLGRQPYCDSDLLSRSGQVTRPGLGGRDRGVRIGTRQAIRNSHGE